jgi:hypothetical protein
VWAWSWLQYNLLHQIYFIATESTEEHGKINAITDFFPCSSVDSVAKSICLY